MSNNNDIEINIKITRRHLTIGLVSVLAISMIIPF